MPDNMVCLVCLALSNIRLDKKKLAFMLVAQHWQRAQGTCRAYAEV